MTDYTVRWVNAHPTDLLNPAHDAWRSASAIEWGADPFRTHFRAVWNVHALSLRFDASDVHPWHTMTGRDDHIWNEEVVEIFLDPHRSGVGYAELEISPANVVCDLVVRRPWPNLLSDPAWHFAKMTTRVVPWRAPDAGPDGWTAFASIPWTDFESLPTRVALPPAPGDRWTFNVFRIKRPRGPQHPDDDVVYAAWSPTGGPSFHVPSAFRDFVFAPSGKGR